MGLRFALPNFFVTINDAEIFEILNRRGAIGGARLILGVEKTEILQPAIYTDRSLVFDDSTSHLLGMSAIRPTVTHILRARTFSQIEYRVVTRIAVDMIDMPFGPLSIVIEPRQPMGAELHIENRNYSISITFNRTRDVASIGAVFPINLPSENASRRVKGK